MRYACDKNLFIFGVYLDLQKAFDTVNHEILLTKLKHYAMESEALLINGFNHFFVKDYNILRSKRVDHQ